MIIKCIRTTSTHSDFLSLVKALDQELAIRNGEDNDFFVQFNKVNLLQYVVIAYEDNNPVACGAMKALEEKTMEIKRMYVLPEKRGGGIAQIILTELETWSKEIGTRRCVLETGDDMLSAIRLYEKSGFVKMTNYGQYAKIENSVCFEKKLD